MKKIDWGRLEILVLIGIDVAYAIVLAGAVLGLW